MKLQLSPVRMQRACMVARRLCDVVYAAARRPDTHIVLRPAGPPHTYVDENGDEVDLKHALTEK